MTACNPNNVSQQELPEDSDNLLDRPEYWIVHKDVLTTALAGDEIALTLTNEGKL